MKLLKPIITIVLFLIVLTAFIISMGIGWQERNELKLYGKIDTATVVKKVRTPKNRNVIYEFYLDNKKITGNESFNGYEWDDIYIGSKYLVKYSSKNPKYSTLMVDKEVD